MAAVIDAPGVPARRDALQVRFPRASQPPVPSFTESSTAGSLPLRTGNSRTWSTPLWPVLQTAGVIQESDADEFTEAELNRLKGANPRLSALLVGELHRYHELADNRTLTNEERDCKLQTWSSDAAVGVVGTIKPVSSRLKPVLGRPADPLLGWVRGLPPPPTTGVPKAEFLYAFGAAAAPHAGSSLSERWLSAYIGRAVAVCARVHKSPSSLTVPLSFAIIQWGSTLYVGIAGLKWDTWGSLLKFFSSPLVEVNEQEVLDGTPSVSSGFPDKDNGGQPMDPANLPGSSISVNAAAWAACREMRGVLDAVRKALTPRATSEMGSASADTTSGRTASRVVFCGHGAAAAVAILLALQYKKHVSGRGLPPGPPSVVTFGCPLFGNAALQTIIRRELPDATRYFVDHDPVAGLPRWSAVGLRFCASAQDVAPHAVRVHRELSPDGDPRIGVSGAPRVASLAVAGVAYGSHHRLEAYALCLTRLWASLMAGAAPSRRKSKGVGGLWRRIRHASWLVKDSRTEGGVTTVHSSPAGPVRVRAARREPLLVTPPVVDHPPLRSTSTGGPTPPPPASLAHDSYRSFKMPSCARDASSKRGRSREDSRLSGMALTSPRSQSARL